MFSPFRCLPAVLTAGTLSLSLSAAQPGVPYDSVVARLRDAGLRSCEGYRLLKDLIAQAPRRLSGSPGAAKAVEVTRKMMEEKGFENVHLEKIMVPHWERGLVEEAVITSPASAAKTRLTICALGGSIATPAEGIEGEMVEVHSFDELHALGDAARNKIVFFNRPMDPTKLNTFEAYGGAVDQRGRGAVEASKAGGVAALVRSMTLALDDVPHAGAMGYVDSVKKVPAAAVSTVGAEMLSQLLAHNKSVRIRMKLTCETLPDEPSANVMGEITGSERPHDVIVVGGHLDCWDKGQGAVDDGGGCMEAIEALNLIKSLRLRPKRTIRAVMFMNEENGDRGGKAYPVAPERTGETTVAALESDAGCFAPRAIGIQSDSTVMTRVKRWQSFFDQLNVCRLEAGYSGVDVSPTVERGTPGFGLGVETHRYFDYHHSDNDTIDKVNPRELEMCAIVEALLCYLISEEGL